MPPRIIRRTSRLGRKPTMPIASRSVQKPRSTLLRRRRSSPASSKTLTAISKGRKKTPFVASSRSVRWPNKRFLCSWPESSLPPSTSRSRTTTRIPFESRPLSRTVIDLLPDLNHVYAYAPQLQAIVNLKTPEDIAHCPVITNKEGKFNSKTKIIRFLNIKEGYCKTRQYQDLWLDPEVKAMLPGDPIDPLPVYHNWHNNWNNLFHVILQIPLPHDE